MNRKEILDAALQAITTDRQSDYGTPENSFSGIADYWNLYLSQREGPIKPHEVGIMLLLMKVKRSTVSPAKADSYVDMAGYAGCAGEIASAAAQPDFKFGGYIPPQAVEAGIKQKVGESVFEKMRRESQKMEATFQAAMAAVPQEARRDTFPPPPEGREWHNPDGLTPEQVGVAEGWRLCLKEELVTGELEWFNKFCWCNDAGAKYSTNTPICGSYTYRTKAPLP